MVLILEDDPERIARFRRALDAHHPDLDVRIWSNAKRMIREAGPLLSKAMLVSLDHDLPLDREDTDPGDGLDMTRFLVLHPTPIPVIVHTANGPRAQVMMGEFELACWTCIRVLPIMGSDWVESDWLSEVTRVLASSRGTAI